MPPAGRRPHTSIVPDVGRSRPAARLSSVLLPAPFGPTSPTTRPAGTSIVQSDSAHRRPYLLPRDWARMMTVMDRHLARTTARRASERGPHRIGPRSDAGARPRRVLSHGVGSAPVALVRAGTEA